MSGELIQIHTEEHQTTGCLTGEEVTMYLSFSYPIEIIFKGGLVFPLSSFAS